MHKSSKTKGRNGLKNNSKEMFISVKLNWLYIFSQRHGVKMHSIILWSIVSTLVSIIIYNPLAILVTSDQDILLKIGIHATVLNDDANELSH